MWKTAYIEANCWMLGVTQNRRHAR